jgi:hypothetical protein
MASTREAWNESGEGTKHRAARYNMGAPLVALVIGLAIANEFHLPK